MVQFMASAMLGASEDLVRESQLQCALRLDQAHTLLQPGNSQACTRFPFFALLMRWVVGV